MSEPPSDEAEEEERESADWPIWETPTIDSQEQATFVIFQCCFFLSLSLSLCSVHNTRGMARKWWWG